LPEGEFDPRTWWPRGTWVVEDKATALARTPEFGRRFFSEVSVRVPQLIPHAVFLRWASQPEDVYVVFPLPECGIGVQIDPDMEYVIVWGTEAVAEFGDWGGDQADSAIDFVAELVTGGIA
jgi:hypothetical protein